MKSEIIIAGQYRLDRKIGKGAFGEIFSGLDLKSRLQVAIKLEPIRSRFPQLIFESKVIKLLAASRPEGIPKVYWTGVEGEYNVMVMQLLGPSLEDLFAESKRKFSLKTATMTISQMLDRIEYIHEQFWLHRDMKPDNFLVGRNETVRTIFLIDFGLAKRYIDQSSGTHIPYKNGKHLTGTARYASINTHRGIEQSRRDDLEGIMHIYIYFLLGALPWQGLPAKGTQEKYQKILAKKEATPLEILCKGLPDQIPKLLSYCRSLKFDEKPSYSYIKKQISEIATKNQFEFDRNFEYLSNPDVLKRYPALAKTSGEAAEPGDPTSSESSSKKEEKKDQAGKTKRKKKCLLL